MKIICMDCQTESYSDVEGLKTKKHLTCAHCSENLQSTSDTEDDTSSLELSEEAFGVYTSSIDAASTEIEIFQPDEEVLDIPERLSVPESYGLTKMDDDVILFPVYESKAPFLEEEACVAPVESMSQVSATLDNSSQFLTTSYSGHESSEQESASLNQAEWAKDVPVQGLESAKKMRLMTFSTTRLIVVAVACVLFIALVEGVITPSPKVSVKAETPAQAVSKPIREAEPAPSIQTPAQTPQASIPPAPAPSPEVVESKPIAATPSTASSTTQSSEKDQAQFTIQVGSHQDEGEANKQAEKLRAAGFEPRVVSVEIPKRGRWYRVQVGYFSDRNEANRFGSQILAKGAAENFVVSGL